MELSNNLKSQGWYLTDKFLTSLKQITLVKDVIAMALDLDFRDIAGGALPAKREDTLPGRIVLQVQKIRNISAPKANEESKTSPRFLQIEFSDGQTSIQGLEMEPVSSLSLNIPPGTKVHFKAERLNLMQGFIVLKANELQVLGGRVEALVEKWEFARTMLHFARSGRRVSGASGPPPWTAFDKKLNAIKEAPPTDRNFKSLQMAGEKEKEVKENAEFNNMRSEAIAEATKAGSKKVFGGGGQQLVDHNVKKILDKGYSEEDAKTALRTTNNNLERALYNLKRRTEGRRSEDTGGGPSRGGRGDSSREMGGGGGGRRGGGAASAREEAEAAKPAGNVSLFDFLTDKLPANTAATSESSHKVTESSVTTVSTASTASQQRSDKFRQDFSIKQNNNRSNRSCEIGATSTSSSSTARTKFENNISSSFAANHQQRSNVESGQKPRGQNADHRNSNERSNGRDNGRYNGREGSGGKNDRAGGGGGGRGNSGKSSNTQEERVSGGNRHSTGSYAGNSRTNNNNNNNNNNRTPGVDRQSASTNSEPRPGGGGNEANNDARRGGGEQRNRNSTNSFAGNKGGQEKSRFNQKETNSRMPNPSINSNNSSGNNNINPVAVSKNPFRVGDQNHAANHDTNMSKLTESTAKMKINSSNNNNQNQNNDNNKARDYGGSSNSRGGHRQQRQSQPRSSQPPKSTATSSMGGSSAGGAGTAPQQLSGTATTAPAAAAPVQYSLLSSTASASSAPAHSSSNNEAKLSNGFTYDPSKIIGFQSKETNEYAMTLLRSQGISSGMMAPQMQQQPAPVHHQQQQQQQHPQHQQQQQQHQQLPIQTYSGMPPPSAAYSAAANNIQPFMMQQLSYGDGWMWKVGDLCLAKYWDDGQYYESEVTGVSDKTCVVFFLGYGNHEEVLKSDCIPITDENHRPINNFAELPSSGAPGMPIGMNNAAEFHRGGAGGSSQRRERQMYVPPHKRDGN